MRIILYYKRPIDCSTGLLLFHPNSSWYSRNMYFT
nr:MAG TPA: Proteasome component C7-alpha [Caudoviricetes sp.]